MKMETIIIRMASQSTTTLTRTTTTTATMADNGVTMKTSMRGSSAQTINSWRNSRINQSTSRPPFWRR